MKYEDVLEGFLFYLLSFCVITEIGVFVCYDWNLPFIAACLISTILWTPFYLWKAQKHYIKDRIE